MFTLQSRQIDNVCARACEIHTAAIKIIVAIVTLPPSLALVDARITSFVIAARSSGTKCQLKAPRGHVYIPVVVPDDN